jgi:hypothetical protein
MAVDKEANCLEQRRWRRRLVRRREFVFCRERRPLVCSGCVDHCALRRAYARGAAHGRSFQNKQVGREPFSVTRCETPCSPVQRGQFPIYGCMSPREQISVLALHATPLYAAPCAPITVAPITYMCLTPYPGAGVSGCTSRPVMSACPPNARGGTKRGNGERTATAFTYSYSPRHPTRKPPSRSRRNPNRKRRPQCK